MGLFGGSTTSTSNSSASTSVNDWQKNYLNTAFNGAQSNYENKTGTSAYSGPTYAGMTDGSRDTLAQIRDYAGTAGMSNANQLSAMGGQMVGTAGNASDMLAKYTDLASSDATASNIEAAGRYADNPYLQAQIDANSRDVVRNLNESTLPSINRQFSAAGGINSSRAGVASGIAQRGAEDRIADISASLRGDAYNNGLSMAQQDRANQLSAYSNAANSYMNMASTGMDAISKGTSAAYGAYDAINGANEAEQADLQGQYDANYEQWKANDTREADLLKQYYGIVGSNSWGTDTTGTETTKQKSSTGILSGILGGLATGAGIYTGIKNA